MTREGLLGVLKQVDEMLDYFPSGVDDEADPDNPSPEDATAHTAGLIRRVLRNAIAQAEGGDRG